MTHPKSHLSPGAQELLGKSDDERIRAVRQEKWINYAAAQEILDDLEDLLAYPSRDRMPCRLIIAESNNGKSRLLSKFRAAHPADPNIGGDAVNVPVLFAILNGPDERMIYRQLLECLFEHLPRSPKPGELQEHVVAVLLRVRPKMILLDEANTIVNGGAVKVRNCFNALKYITNRTGIPIVAAGTREALSGFRSDSQMENRFEPRYLPIWSKVREVRELLAAFEQLTPLRNPSDLQNPAMAKDVLNRTGGLIGEIATLIAKAAVHAIRNKSETITVETLAACGYVPLSTRKSMLM